MGLIISTTMFCDWKKVTPKEGGVTLLIIDPQNDFASKEAPQGSLYVDNADEDTKRVVNFILESIKDTDDSTSDGTKVEIDRIVVSLDSHHKFHIAHPCFWTDKDGKKNPGVFTQILSSAIEDGTWKPTEKAFEESINGNFIDENVLDNGVKEACMDMAGNLDLVKYCIEYTKKLEEGGRFNLTVWPEHCIIGTEGNDIVKELKDVLDKWEDVTGNKVEIVAKGQNNLTEMYSALSAEVPLSKETQFNQDLFDSLNLSDKIFVAGEAKSHCVNYTVRDMLKNMKDSEKEKVYLMSDCTSPVPMCESAADEFEKFVTEEGGHVITSDEAIAMLQ